MKWKWDGARCIMDPTLTDAPESDYRSWLISAGYSDYGMLFKGLGRDMTVFRHQSHRSPPYIALLECDQGSELVGITNIRDVFTFFNGIPELSEWMAIGEAIDSDS